MSAITHSKLHISRCATIHQDICSENLSFKPLLKVWSSGILICTEGGGYERFRLRAFDPPFHIHWLPTFISDADIRDEK
jgi:hypothetical protein